VQKGTPLRRRPLAVLFLAVAAFLAGCHLARPGAEPPAPKAPAKSAETQTPPAKAPAKEATKSEAVSNARCHVCHMNYEDEWLAVKHAKNGVGCMTCHGESDDHCGDENNITPPDRMYPRDTIARACMMCHSLSKLQKKPKEHEAILPDPKKAEKVCTDCHGKHRLERRTTRWDKATGKLLPADKPPAK
jgi:hypothetical protein